MLKNYFIKGILFVFCIGAVFSSSGCDKIQGWMASSSGAKQGATTVNVSTETTKKQPAAKDVLVRIGDWTMTIDEFNDRLDALQQVIPDFDPLNPQTKELVLEELIRQQLLVVDAERSGLAKKKEIADAVEEFRRTLIVREAAKQLIDNITVSDSEALNFYEKNKAGLVEPPEFTVRGIVLNSKEKANEVLVEALKGVGFAELAKQHSANEDIFPVDGTNVYNAENPPEFPKMAEVLLSLDQGDISTVFEGPNKAFYIIKVIEKTGGEQIPFADIKDDIKKNQQVVKQQEAILSRIKQLRSDINVVVNKELLNK